MTEKTRATQGPPVAEGQGRRHEVLVECPRCAGAALVFALRGGPEPGLGLVCRVCDYSLRRKAFRLPDWLGDDINRIPILETMRRMRLQAR
jgi:hypothetical protein